MSAISRFNDAIRTLWGRSLPDSLRPAATQEEMEAGTETALRDVSPLRVAQAIAALGGGGAGIVTKVCYVQTTGDDDSAEVGNPAKPFATAQAAFNAGVSLGAFSMRFGVGSFGGIVVTADMDYNCGLFGEGYGISVITGINGNSADAPSPPDDDSPGFSAGNAKRLYFVSDGSVDVTSVTSNGGAGGLGGVNDQTGGNGGAGGFIRLVGLNGSGVCESKGGDPGAGGGLGAAGNGGDAAEACVSRCTFAAITHIPGLGASGGSSKISMCIAGSIMAAVSEGFVAHCMAYSLVISGGVADLGNSTTPLTPTP